MEIRGKEYEFKRLDAFQQLYIAKRIAPVFGSLIGVFKKCASIDEASKSFKIDQEKFFESLEELGEVLSRLSDENLQFTVINLLKSVRRKDVGGMMSPVVASDMIMFKDISDHLPTMIELSGRALMANGGDFFEMLSSRSKDGSLKQKDQ